MISRVWHGWTTHGDADAFEAIVRTELYPATLARNLLGFRGSQLLRLARAGQTEFMIISWFDDMDAVRRFAGDDYENPMVTPKARALLRRSDSKPEHYEVREASEPVVPLRSRGATLQAEGALAGAKH